MELPILRFINVHLGSKNDSTFDSDCSREIRISLISECVREFYVRLRS